MKLKELSAADQRIFRKFLNLQRHELSVYAFENIYIWKGLFEIRWAIISGSLCIFFKDKISCFLYLPPLAKHSEPEVLRESFGIMDGFNRNPQVSRIENAEAVEVAFYRGLGYVCKPKSCDYLYSRSDLVRLSGNKFKSKRADYNYFIRNYSCECREFSIKSQRECLRLYDRWMQERRSAGKDEIYKGMLADSRRSFTVMLDNFRRLDIQGMVVENEGKIKGMTFGFALNQDTFCVLYEITDLAVKGLSQFIFREFCRRLKNYTLINAMDDSGLENLKKVKLSYRPLKLVPAYIVGRKL
jgi:uncharacterized protein